MVNPGPVPHVGGPISVGCPTVLIGMMPAARVGDMAVCVGPPDSIVKGSLGVLIGGMPAARIGDLTAHGGVITVGMPTVMIGEIGGGAGGGGGKGVITKPTPKGEFSEALADTETDVGKDGFEARALYVKGKGQAGAETGVAARGEAEAGLVQVKGAVPILGSDKNNPLLEVGGEANVVQAKAKGDLLIGDDGRRVGLSVGGGVGFTSASVDGKVELNIRIPFTDYSFSIRGGGGVSAPGSLGVAAGGHGYYDKNEKRAHLGAFAGGKLGIGGVDVGLDISFGRKYQSRERLTD